MQTIADLTLRDLNTGANRLDARHELRVAQDLGGEAERAAWVAKWGEAIAELLLANAED